MAELKNFGAVFTFAIQQEQALEAYYTQRNDAQKATDARERQTKLERARREHVLEITLEPIEGLDEADYTLNTSDTSDDGAAFNARQMQRFYSAAAEKVNVRQAQRILEKCAKAFNTD